jgi:chromatin remodeling complex protein RSC6
MSRPGVVQKIWAHVREHNLQKPTDRRTILSDAALRPIFNGAVRQRGVGAWLGRGVNFAVFD